MASSTQEPSVKILKKNKMKLASWLRTDFQYILQHAHSGDLVDDRVYQRLKNKALPEEDACIDLIDSLVSRGDGPSSAFLELLKDPEIHNTYNEELKDWILSLELPGPTEPQRPNISLSVADKGHFFLKNQGALVSRVKNVGPIVDDMKSEGGLQEEMAASIRAQNTPQERMRRILESTNSNRAREALFKALLEHEPGVMEDLLG